MVAESILNDARRYATEIRRELGNVTCYLYGSHAYGTPTPDSDIDIAVVMDRVPDNRLKISKLLWRTARKVNCTIEPILLNASNDQSGFAKMVAEKGILLT